MIPMSARGGLWFTGNFNVRFGGLAMGIREVITRARQAQQDHPQKHPVQLELDNTEILAEIVENNAAMLRAVEDGDWMTLAEIEEEEDWKLHSERIAEMISQGEQAAREYGTILPATYDEYMEEFRRTTLDATDKAVIDHYGLR
jgi:hypothetical protein